ncbi:methyl-accepting chemotaxis protein [Aliivibrio fischeri]|nr:methyl-accepting chemotaxis protein [Aliivibrio fischeri]
MLIFIIGKIMIKKINIAFVCILITLVFLCSLGAYFYILSWKENSDSIKDADHVSTDSIIKTYDFTLSNLADEVQMVSSFITFDPNEEFDQKAALDFLKNAVKNNDALTSAWFASLDGHSFSVFSNGWTPNYNARTRKREWYLSIMDSDKSVNISAPYVTLDGKVSLAISTPIIQHNRKIGVFSVYADLSKLMPELGVEYAITDQQGLVLAADEQGKLWVNKNIYDIRPGFSQVDKDLLLYQEPKGEWRSVSKHALGQGQYLFIITDQDEIITTANMWVYAVIMTLVFIGLILTSAVYWILRGELKYLPKLVSVITDMSKGNFSSINIPRSNNELDTIVSSLCLLEQRVSSVVKSSENLMGKLIQNQAQISEDIHISYDNAQKEIAEIEQVATAATELAATASDVAKNAVEGENSTNSTMEVIADSSVTLERSLHITQQVHGSTTESAAVVEQLREYSENISSVVDVINNISEQTNLLALNAAIEAARAGDQGRGFAVVADEVRALAAKTQQSTVDIQGIIVKLQLQSQQASDFMTQNSSLVDESKLISEQIAEAFKTIKERVTTISDINTMVATASEEQLSVTQDMSERLEDVNNIVQQNLSSVQQTTFANDDISKLVAQLKLELDFFKIK